MKKYLIALSSVVFISCQSDYVCGDSFCGAIVVDKKLNGDYTLQQGCEFHRARLPKDYKKGDTVCKPTVMERIGAQAKKLDQDWEDALREQIYWENKLNELKK